MIYNWQQPDGPQFQYDIQEIEEELFTIAEQTGQVSGMLNSLPDAIKEETIINTMVAEAVKTSEIEGEYLTWTSQNQKGNY